MKWKIRKRYTSLGFFMWCLLIYIYIYILTLTNFYLSLFEDWVVFLEKLFQRSVWRLLINTGKVEILQYYFMRAAPLDFLRNGKSRNITLHHPRPTGLMRAELVAFDIGKVEILQYYGGRAGQYIATAFGFPLFLAELVVSGIGKVEKLQYYLIPGLLPARATGFPLF